MSSELRRSTRVRTASTSRFVGQYMDAELSDPLSDPSIRQSTASDSDSDPCSSASSPFASSSDEDGDELQEEEPKERKPVKRRTASTAVSRTAVSKRARTTSSPAVEATPAGDLPDLDPHSVARHRFSSASDPNGQQHVTAIRQALLDWYRACRRPLPWRDVADDVTIPLEQRAYTVWVSEIMCQQTQVATVLPYFARWMEKWPTVEDLARATEEEVAAAWAGLGYYGRSRRLLEGAQKVAATPHPVSCIECDHMPIKPEDPSAKTHRCSRIPAWSPSELARFLPGVGPYTAGAIASIAGHQPCALVDGNVTRVLIRLMRVRAPAKNCPPADRWAWRTARTLARGHEVPDTVDALPDGGIGDGGWLPDPEDLRATNRPGDLNQALMELGAMVCTPVSPQCGICPLRSLCRSNELSTSGRMAPTARPALSLKLEEDEHIQSPGPMCDLCQPRVRWADFAEPSHFPAPPAARAAAPVQAFLLCIVSRTSTALGQEEFFLTRRPTRGLLAGLWEFPSFDVQLGFEELDALPAEEAAARAASLLDIAPKKWAYGPGPASGDTTRILDCGSFQHVFSHRRHGYRVMAIALSREYGQGGRTLPDTADGRGGAGAGDTFAQGPPRPAAWASADAILKKGSCGGVAGNTVEAERLAIGTSNRKAFALLQAASASTVAGGAKKRPSKMAIPEGQSLMLAFLGSK
ncbi:hypothetical protein H696_03685 [Fonticula alba]|uniref:Adenine DNA glycosylase n=1 Tax=Fonticula alba TaxID=691883 RepID=A0A058Z5N9_FONAL|nr:hypothetical protein H696_03685 [Fonticula alba]KCV69258.1 hypothetical protein H696_03685 [Fonticula alba]|eukprot:XP_009495823.1 hypothetical protein H696_03685 [Fonticula alba]